MRGAIPPLPNTPSWRGAQLKKEAQGQLYLYIWLILLRLPVPWINVLIHSVLVVHLRGVAMKFPE
jgi:hypothetical protein